MNDIIDNFSNETLKTDNDIQVETLETDNNDKKKLEVRKKFNNKKIFTMIAIALVCVIGIILVLNTNKDSDDKVFGKWYMDGVYLNGAWYEADVARKSDIDIELTVNKDYSYLLIVSNDTRQSGTIEIEESDDGDIYFFDEANLMAMPDKTDENSLMLISTDDNEVGFHLVREGTESTLMWEEYSQDTNSNYSNTSSATSGEKNALEKALQYLDYSAFSYSGLIEQLEYEGFTEEEATYAVDNCGADWYEQAVLKAEQYLDYSSFSRSGLIEQLEYEGFTSSQAEHAVDLVY